MRNIGSSLEVALVSESDVWSYVCVHTCNLADPTHSTKITQMYVISEYDNMIIRTGIRGQADPQQLVLLVYLF